MSLVQQVDRAGDRIAHLLELAGTRYFTSIAVAFVGVGALGLGLVLLTDPQSLFRQPPLRYVVWFAPPHIWALARILLGGAVLVPAIASFFNGKLSRLRLAIPALVGLGVQYCIYGYLVSLSVGSNSVPTAVWIFSVLLGGSALVCVLGSWYADHGQQPRGQTSA